MKPWPDNRPGLTLIALLTAVSIPTPAPGAPPDLRPQEASLWCWAAAGQMVMEGLSLNGNFSQGEQAKKVIEGCTSPPTDTCGATNPVFGDCNSPGSPAFGHFNFMADVTRSPLDWSVLKIELDSCRPFVFGWCVPRPADTCPPNPDGHWMVAAAADVCLRQNGAGVPMVRILNPAPCCAGQTLWIPYSLYESAGAKLAFWENHHNVRPAGQAAVSPNNECRLTEALAEPAANFTGANGTAVATAVLQDCFPTAGRWTSSKLLRPALPPAAVDGSPTPAAGRVRRRHLSRSELAALSATDAADDDQALPALWVYPMKIGNEEVANIVLEQTAANAYRLVAIEDSLSARRLVEKVALVQSADSVVEIVVVETGLRFLLEDGDAVVTEGELDCSDVALVKAKTATIPYQQLVGAILAQ